MRAWIRVLDAPGCYERTAWAERKSALQGSGMVRTVGPFAHSRVPRVIATELRMLRICVYWGTRLEPVDPDVISTCHVLD